LEPLQRLATVSSTFALQTIGVEAFRDGNVIQISDDNHQIPLGVVEQCSGLRMLTIFFALCVAIVLVAPRPWWEATIIILSAIPIALAVNVTRITVTGLLHLWVGQEWANAVFHDFAGWVMMPMAMLLLYVEITLLSHLFVEESRDQAPPVGIPINLRRPKPTA
jgi:exosortase